MADKKRANPKSLPIGYQERRRTDALERQRAARAEATNKARQFSIPHDDDALLTDSTIDDITASEQQQSSSHPSSPTLYWSRQLTIPEWLIEIPSNLSTHYYIIPRPQGQRCLVTATRGRTTARTRSGSIFETFNSLLPSGSPQTVKLASSGQQEECILDCVYAEDSCTYYIVDVMMWKGYDLCNCTAEFRQFWIHTKIKEDCPSGLNNNSSSSNNSGGGGERAFVPLPAYPADTQGLAAAAPRTNTMEGGGGGGGEPIDHHHHQSFPFTQDGVLFLHKEGHYTAGETTPLALLWKDAACSHYYIDTDADGNVQQDQLVVLEYRHDDDGTVVTGDTPPIVLAQMPDQFRSSPAITRAIHQSSNSSTGGTKKVVRGRPVLLRFAIGPGGFQFHTYGGDDNNNDCRSVGADLVFKGAANSRRGRADTLTKMLFQYLARRQPITFEDLVTAASGGGGVA